MKDNSSYLITVRFPGFKEGEHVFGAYGYKYLFNTSIVPFPEWPENDERWADWSEEKVVKGRFIDWYTKDMSKEFTGEILFVESADNIIIANRLETKI